MSRLYHGCYSLFFGILGVSVLTNTHCLQIELDLLRTLPNNKHYEAIDSEGVIKLRKVLLAFSEYNKMIGYCQVNDFTF